MMRMEEERRKRTDHNQLLPSEVFRATGEVLRMRKNPEKRSNRALDMTHGEGKWEEWNRWTRQRWIQSQPGSFCERGETSQCTHPSFSYHLVVCETAKVWHDEDWNRHSSFIRRKGDVWGSNKRAGCFLLNIEDIKLKQAEWIIFLWNVARKSVQKQEWPRQTMRREVSSIWQLASETVQHPSCRSGLRHTCESTPSRWERRYVIVYCGLAGFSSWILISVMRHTKREVRKRTVHNHNPDYFACIGHPSNCIPLRRRAIRALNPVGQNGWIEQWFLYSKESFASLQAFRGNHHSDNPLRLIIFSSGGVSHSQGREQLPEVRVLRFQHQAFKPPSLSILFHHLLLIQAFHSAANSS